MHKDAIVLCRICAFRGRDKYSPSSPGKSNVNFTQRLEIGGGVSNTITSVGKDNMLFMIVRDEGCDTEEVQD